MLYVIWAEDAEDAAAKRAATRADHLVHLDALQARGRLILAGPRPRADTTDVAAAGVLGSLLVVEFDTLAEAQAWAAKDPYAEAGVFAETRIEPFVQVFPR
jgi:uncharacterized protein YciI